MSNSLNRIFDDEDGEFINNNNSSQPSIQPINWNNLDYSDYDDFEDEFEEIKKSAQSRQENNYPVSSNNIFQDVDDYYSPSSKLLNNSIEHSKINAPICPDFIKMPHYAVIRNESEIVSIFNDLVEALNFYKEYVEFEHNTGGGGGRKYKLLQVDIESNKIKPLELELKLKQN